MKLKGVILAAGDGKRLRPLTNTRPKPMLPVAGKTLLQHNIDKMIAAGIDSIIIVIPKDTTQQLSDFLKVYYPNISLCFVEQEEPLGTAHAVDIVKSQIADSDFLMVYGDNITAYDYSKLIKRHRSDSALATLALMRTDEPQKYGVVEVNEEKIIGIVEKPENPKSNLVFAGMCVFTPNIFEAIKQTKKSPTGEYYLTDSLQLLIEWKHKIGYSILDTWRFNVNDHADLLKANKLLLSEEYVNQNGQSSTFQIIPPVFIGKNVNLESNVVIGPHVTLEHDSMVGEGTTIIDSVLLPRTKIGKNCFIVNSILGENSHVGDDVYTSEGESVALVLGDGEKLNSG